MGDVLRTTTIIHPLKSKYKGSNIIWCTTKDSTEFLHNVFIDEVIVYEYDAALRLLYEKYDLAINLDSSKRSSALATIAQGGLKQGFILDEKGFVIPTSEAEEKWLWMSVFDGYKKKNKRSYQEFIYDILELDVEISRPSIILKNIENKKSLLTGKVKIEQTNNWIKTRSWK